MTSNDQPQREMTESEIAAQDAKAEKFYKRQIKLTGYQATLSKNQRDIAVNKRDELEARIQTYGMQGRLKKLAEEEGIQLDSQPAAPAPVEKVADHDTSAE